jgi:O-antigen ligase
MKLVIKWLYLASLFLVLFTLAKELPPFRIYLLDIALIPFLLALLFNCVLSPTRIGFRWQRIDTLVIVLFFTVTCAFLLSEDRVYSIVSYLDWARIITMYFSSRIVFINTVSELSFRRLMWLSASVLLFVGVIQWTTGTSFGLIGNYFGTGTDQAVTANVAGVGSRSRISGTTTNPIIFAIWVTIFSLIVASDLNAKRRHILFVFHSFVSAVVVLSTLSRGAIAAFSMSLIIFVFINRKDLVRIAYIGMIIMIFILPLAYFGIMRSTVGETATMLQARIERQELLEEDSARVNVIKMGFKLLKEPKIFIFGSGPDNMVLAYNKYISGTFSKKYSQSNRSYQRSGIHNVWIKMIVEYGFMSGFLLILVWLSVFFRTLKLWLKRDSDHSAKIWGGSLIAFLIPYFLIDCGVYESAMSYHVFIPLFALMGYLVTNTQTDSKTKQIKAPQEGPIVPYWKDKIGA